MSRATSSRIRRGPPGGCPTPHGGTCSDALGFPDVPDGFEALLMRSLGEVGAIVGYREFSGLGRGIIVDFDGTTRQGLLASLITATAPKRNSPDASRSHRYDDGRAHVVETPSGGCVVP